MGEFDTTPGGVIGVIRVLSDSDDQMGAKMKTQKNAWTKI